MAESAKRKVGPDGGDHVSKKANKLARRPWTANASHRSRDGARTGSLAIEPGDAGIWATCNIGQEGKCVGELRDLLEKYADKLHVEDGTTGRDDGDDDDNVDGDIESSIQKELQELRRPAQEKVFTAVRIDVQCRACYRPTTSHHAQGPGDGAHADVSQTVVFFKVRPPLAPVSLVHRICTDAAVGGNRKGSRYIQRLTPISLVARASDEGLTQLAAQVLPPHFYEPNGPSKKFAIRPSIRSNSTMKRDAVINLVAAAVGPGHRVDLKHYDVLILVDIFKGICGMSVVPADYERLKRYNLAELPGSGPGSGPKHQSAAAFVAHSAQDPTTFKRMTEMEADGKGETKVDDDDTR